MSSTISKVSAQVDDSSPPIEKSADPKSTEVAPQNKEWNFTGDPSPIAMHTHAMHKKSITQYYSITTMSEPRATWAPLYLRPDMETRTCYRAGSRIHLLTCGHYVVSILSLTLNHGLIFCRLLLTVLNSVVRTVLTPSRRSRCLSAFPLPMLRPSGRSAPPSSPQYMPGKLRRKTMATKMPLPPPRCMSRFSTKSGTNRMSRSSPWLFSWTVTSHASFAALRVNATRLQQCSLPRARTSASSLEGTLTIWRSSTSSVRELCPSHRLPSKRRPRRPRSKKRMLRLRSVTRLSISVPSHRQPDLARLVSR